MTPSMQERSAGELPRVRSVIADDVLEFCRCWCGYTVHLAAIENYVQARLRGRGEREATPGSASRVLRDLRSQGVIDYSVESRRDSLYKIRRVALGALSNT